MVPLGLVSGAQRPPSPPQEFLLLKNPLGVTLQHPLGEPYLLPIGAELVSG